MILEEITSFNFHHYLALLPARWQAAAYQNFSIETGALSPEPVDAFVSNASSKDGSIRSDAIGTIASTGFAADSLDVNNLWLGCRNDRGEPVGCLIGGSEREDRFLIRHLEIRADSRRQGFGSGLVKRCQEAVRGKFAFAVYRYTPDFDVERDGAFDFAEKMGFAHRLEKVLFVFDAKKVIAACAPHETAEFEIVAESDAFETNASTGKNETLEAVCAHDPFTDMNAPEMRELRNRVVLDPCGESFRIVERMTGREAGFFSTAVCDGKYFAISAVCIRPEFRSRIYLWTLPVLFSARSAESRGLSLASYVFYWRSAEIRFYRHFAARFGLLHSRMTFYFRADLTQIWKLHLRGLCACDKITDKSFHWKSSDHEQRKKHTDGSDEARLHAD